MKKKLNALEKLIARKLHKIHIKDMLLHFEKFGDLNKKMQWIGLASSVIQQHPINKLNLSHYRY